VAAALSSFPFFLALLAAYLAEVSATLLRRVAATLGTWLYWLAGALSTIAAGCLIWSYLWALSLADPGQKPHPFLQALGALILLAGGSLMAWSMISLGAQTLFAIPGSRLVRGGPYQYVRRPMGIALILLGIGGAIAFHVGPLWTWTGAWFLLSLPVFELEEWEMRSRLPHAHSYLEHTRRYLPRRPG
jgi:protein-S-isoprenylcysteine O-methyltransferase Ste14